MDWLKKLIEAIKKIAGEDADLSEIEKLAEEGVKAEIKTATEKLSESKGNILAEKKALQAKLKLFDGIDPDKYNETKKLLEELSERELIEVGDFDTVKKAIQEKHSKELKAKDDEIVKLTASLHDLLVDQGLTSALQKNGIAERYLPACRALLRDGVQITEDGGEHKATAGDVPLADYVAKWAKSDDGKIYVAAKDNSGGGSGGSSDGDGGNGGADETRYKELLKKLEEGKATGKEIQELSKLGETMKAERNQGSEGAEPDDSNNEE